MCCVAVSLAVLKRRCAYPGTEGVKAWERRSCFSVALVDCRSSPVRRRRAEEQTEQTDRVSGLHLTPPVTGVLSRCDLPFTLEDSEQRVSWVKWLWMGVRSTDCVKNWWSAALVAARCGREYEFVLCVCSLRWRTFWYLARCVRYCVRVHVDREKRQSRAKLAMAACACLCCVVQRAACVYTCMNMPFVSVYTRV